MSEQKSIIEQVIDRHNRKPDKPINLSSYAWEITVDDLIFFRNNNLNTFWNDPGYSLDDEDLSLEVRLELIEWMDDRDIIAEISHDTEDDILLRLKEKGIKIRFIRTIDQWLNFIDVVKYVNKYKLVDQPVRVKRCQDDILTSYCQLIGYPLKRYNDRYYANNLFFHLNNGETRYEDYRGDPGAVYNRIDTRYLTAYGVYNSLQHPNISGGHELQGFQILINRDDKMEYCIREEFRDLWYQVDSSVITNRAALQYLKDLGVDIINTEDIIENLDSMELNLEEFKTQLDRAHLTTDLVDSFDHLDTLITIGTDITEVVAIIIRLLMRRLINLEPYLDDPIIEHLYQFQHRPKLKSARNKE